MTTDEIIIIKREFEDHKKILLELLFKVEKIYQDQYQKPLTITEVKQMGIGGYDRIKRLIQKGKLKVTSDGKITRQSLESYLNPDVAKDVQECPKMSKNDPLKHKRQ